MDYKTFQGLTEGRFLKSLYHMTHSAATILSQNTLKGSVLSSGEQKVVERSTGLREDEKFYISFARANTGSYTRADVGRAGIRTVLQFDKNKLDKFGRFVQVDFFANSSSRGEELEERLLIRNGKEGIPVMNTLVAIHVYDPNEARKSVLKRKIAQLQGELKKLDPRAHIGLFDRYTRWLDDYTKELEKIEKTGYSGDTNLTAESTLKAILDTIKGTDIPVYVYANTTDFNATRFSHAAQMNLALDDDDEDEDL